MKAMEMQRPPPPGPVTPPPPPRQSFCNMRHTHALTSTRTCTCAQPLPHSLTHSLTHPLTHALTHSHRHTHTHTHTHTCDHMGVMPEKAVPRDGVGMLPMGEGCTSIKEDMRGMLAVTGCRRGRDGEARPVRSTWLSPAPRAPACSHAAACAPSGSSPASHGIRRLCCNLAT